MVTEKSQVCILCEKIFSKKHTWAAQLCLHYAQVSSKRREKKCISKKGKNVTSRREIEDACLLVCTKNHLLKPDLSKNKRTFSVFTSKILNYFVLKRL